MGGAACVPGGIVPLASRHPSALAKIPAGPQTQPRSRPPAIGRLLNLPEVVQLVQDHGHRRVVAALRSARELTADPGPGLEARIGARAAALLGPRSRLLPVINGTGVVVHTNLGRAPIAAAAARRAVELAGRYTNLELDLEEGGRGDRQDLLSTLLCQLSGAEAALVVNNGAAALLLALAGLCRGRQVLVSRGEAVEIGGGFRIPEILRLSGARLVDVGTTNRTRLSDYRDACGPRTAAFLRVHASNFRIQGFTARVPGARLAELAHRRGVWLFEDLGSGLMGAPTAATPGEVPLARSVAAGADLVMASGDKLLGASQAGLIVGRAELLGRLRRHPLLRALRPDKLQLAVLEETLLCHANPGRLEEVPVWRMLRASPAQLRRRCRGWLGTLAQAGVAAELLPLRGVVGGGAAPGAGLDSFGIVVRHPRPRWLRAQLLRGEPSVLGLERQGGVVIDARTVLPDEDRQLLEAILEALAGPGGGAAGATP